MSCQITAICPCIGQYSTTLGDEVCSGCHRTLDEVTRWPQMTDEERLQVNLRVATERERFMCDQTPAASGK